MKFLHTGDWHLGKTLYNTPLIDDQKHFLEQILKIFSEAEKGGEPYDALIIPGDLYDRAVPSVAAVKLFDNFLDEMGEKFSGIHIFVLAGNHDGPDRLGFASGFLERANIHICTEPSQIEKATLINGTAVYQIPFLMPGTFGDETSTQNELYKKAVGIIEESHKKNHPALPLVVCAHATVYGNDGDYLSIGTAASIEQSLFDSFTYTALGHIHKFQKLGKFGKMFYSGSPIAYSFDDTAEKFFISVKIGSDTEKPESIEKIPVDTLHPVKRLTGKFQDFKDNEEYDIYKNCYIEIKSTDDAPIKNAKQLLRGRFPHLLSFVMEKTLSMEQNENFRERRKMLQENKSDSDFLRRFLEEIYTKKDGDGKTTIDENAKIEEKIKLFEELLSDDSERNE